MGCRTTSSCFFDAHGMAIFMLCSLLSHQVCALPFVAKMVSHAIFQYNVLVIDMDNTTLGLI
jgi:hypothetical protein